MKRNIKIDVSKLRFYCDIALGHKLYAQDIDENTARYYQVDKNGNLVYTFLGRKE